MVHLLITLDIECKNCSMIVTGKAVAKSYEDREAELVSLKAELERITVVKVRIRHCTCVCWS